MDHSTNEAAPRDAIGDHAADSADHRAFRTNVDGQTETCVGPGPTAFEVRRVDHRLGVVLTLDGELDLATLPVLQEQLSRVMRGRGTVVIDLSGLRFIDSSGLQLLMQAEQQLQTLGGHLVLVRGSAPVRRIFELTGFDRYFACCDSPSAGLRTAPEPATHPKPRRQPTDRPSSTVKGR